MKFAIAALLGASVSAIQFGGGYSLNGGYGSQGSLRELDSGVRSYGSLDELSGGYSGYGDLEELDGGYGGQGGYGGYGGQLDSSFGGGFGGYGGGGSLDELEGGYGGSLDELDGGHDLRELGGHHSNSYNAREDFGLGNDFGFGLGGFGYKGRKGDSLSNINGLKDSRGINGLSDLKDTRGIGNLGNVKGL